MSNFVAFSGEEVREAPILPKKIRCDKCGKRHIVRKVFGVESDGSPGETSLEMYRCKGHTYLAGINGKDIRYTR